MSKTQLKLLPVEPMLLHVHYLLYSTRSVYSRDAPPSVLLLDVVHGLEMIRCAILLHCCFIAAYVASKLVLVDFIERCSYIPYSEDCHVASFVDIFANVFDRLH
ncbi:hypothetical protein TNCV_4723021 [Trichonephila clavipes]|uniref:Uncharacterized protein n=1 Tax=Trichonephila clavipes TaxID=2585209 RepID=A0A8X6W764_TRICX|nr:hypothetical protein TNCV_4723021 [Trichonephila clavipes]